LRRTRQQIGKRGSVAPAASPPAAEAAAAVTAAGDDLPVSTSNLSLHELFEQQARNMLERADIDEEQRQSILVAMACPCCGAGGMSFSVKITEAERRDD
jgi:hypothetical protein